jgi:hypothetical protein
MTHPDEVLADLEEKRLRRPKPMGVDPATEAGIAFDSDRLGFVLQTINIEDSALVQQVCVEARDAGVTHAFVEDAYMGPNVGSFKTLVEIRTHWMLRLSDLGIEVRSVTASTWKAKMIPGVQKRAPQKEAAYNLARELGHDPDDDNQADAVCLYEFGRRVLDDEKEQ